MNNLRWTNSQQSSWYEEVSEYQELPGSGVTGGIGENVDKHRWFIISMVVRAEKVLKIHRLGSTGSAHQR